MIPVLFTQPPVIVGVTIAVASFLGFLIVVLRRPCMHAPLITTLVMVTVGLVIAAVVGISGIRKVDEGVVAVATFGGAVLDKKVDPGYHFLMPWVYG